MRKYSEYLKYFDLIYVLLCFIFKKLFIKIINNDYYNKKELKLKLIIFFNTYYL